MPAPYSKVAGMPFIPLTKDKRVRVSCRDYGELSKHRWYAQKAGRHYYAARRIGRNIVLLHREVLAAPTGILVDHRDGNSLNCVRNNLRFATQAQNLQSRPKQSGTCTSPHKGVCFVPKINARNPWMAYIGSAKARKYLGYFPTEEAAGRAYNTAAKKLFKAFAWENSI